MNERNQIRYTEYNANINKKDDFKINLLELILAIPQVLFVLFFGCAFLFLVFSVATFFIDGVLICTNNFETRILKTSFDSKEEIKYTLQRKGLFWSDVTSTYKKDIAHKWQERYNINTFAEEVLFYDGNDITKESNNQPPRQSKIVYTVPLW